MKTKIIAAILAAAFLVGCANTGNKQLGKMQSGEIQQAIVEGKTTKNQVRAALGDPTSVDIDTNGNEKWTYQHVKSTAKAESFIPVVNWFVQGTNDKTKTLVIVFDNRNVVVKKAFSEGKGETRVGLLG